MQDWWLIVLVVLTAGGVWLVARGRSSRSQAETPRPKLTFEFVVQPQDNSPLEEQTRGDESDAWEGSFWDATAAKTLRKEILLEYTDKIGRLTQRQVSVRQFDEISNLFIGHCALRDATRTFKFSGVVACFDAETGEIIPDLKAYFVNEYEKTTDHSLDRLVHENFDSLSVLLFVGKIDARLTKKENAEIAVWAQRLVADERLTGEMLRELFSSWSIPTLGSFRLAVGRLKQTPIEYRIKLVAACEAMIGTKVKVSPTETDTLRYLKKRLLEL